MSGTLRGAAFQAAIPNRITRRMPAPLLILVFAISCATLPAGDGASRVNETLTKLKQPKSTPSVEVFRLAENDLNEFANVVARSKPQLGVQSVVLDLQPGGAIVAEAVLDMDKVQVGGMAVSMFRTLFSGIQTFRCAGRLVVEGRKGYYDVDEASLSETWVPAWLAESVIGYLGESRGGVDPTEEFELPFGIRTVTVTHDSISMVR